MMDGECKYVHMMDGEATHTCVHTDGREGGDSCVGHYLHVRSPGTKSNTNKHKYSLIFTVR
jgi:hypothetical protein